MSALLMSASPGDIPHEPTDVEMKVAAAAAAQATARTAQVVADEYKKAASEAIAADPMADTQKVNMREVCHEATDSVIELLRKVNAPKE